MLDCDLNGSNAMVEDAAGESLADGKRNLKDQKQLDSCAEGFGIGRLSRLMSSEATYTGELEDLYDKMLAKLDGLSRLVEQTNAQVLEKVRMLITIYLCIKVLIFVLGLRTVKIDGHFNFI